MSLFEKLKEKITGNGVAEETKYISDVPKLDGKVEDTYLNRCAIDAVKQSGVGNGIVLSYAPVIAGENFNIYSIDILANCYDRRNEEEFLLARTYYGIIDGVDKDNNPRVKNFITQFDMDAMLLNDGKWDEKVHSINSFAEPIRLYDFDAVQPMNFRFDSAIFRASENGGIVYSLAPNERIKALGNNAFSIEKTEVTSTTYIVATADKQALAVSDSFENASQDYMKSALDASMQLNKDLRDRTFDN